MVMYVCLGKQKQCEGSPPGERNACQAYAEKAIRGREEKSLQEVGHCIGLKAKEDAASKPPVEQHWYGPHHGECCSSGKISQVFRAG